MSNFEITSIVLSGLAIFLSLPALIFSIIKVANERKTYKKQFIIDNLIKLRSNLDESLTALDRLDPEISMAFIFKRIANGENFDYYNEILKLNNEINVIINNSLLLLCSYKETKYSKKLSEILKDISEDASNCLRIVIENKDKDSILIKYYDYKVKQSNIKAYTRTKNIIINELTNTINHFIKDNISRKEIDSYFIQIKLSDKN